MRGRLGRHGYRAFPRCPSDLRSCQCDGGGLRRLREPPSWAATNRQPRRIDGYEGTCWR